MLHTQKTTKTSKKECKTLSSQCAVKIMQNLMEREKQDYKYDAKIKENIYNVSREKMK